MNESEQINFVVDDYQDLFSDFDSRDYDKKSLSDDFLSECKKASQDKGYEGLELQILIPKNIKNERKESIIKERLLNHFKKHQVLTGLKKKSIIKKGLLFIIISAALLISSTLLHYYLENQSGLVLSMFFVVFEPMGVFFLWQGLDMSIFGPNKIKEEYEFYKKMSKTKIVFETLNDVSLIKKGSRLL
ncbi:MAG: hypothetical protein WC393_01565 [Candidatus Nanoarchaeia archaeon]|jgi:hypothetical protein